MDGASQYLTMFRIVFPLTLTTGYDSCYYFVCLVVEQFFLSLDFNNFGEKTANAPRFVLLH